jgi:hypothetical protein
MCNRREAARWSRGLAARLTAARWSRGSASPRHPGPFANQSLWAFPLLRRTTLRCRLHIGISRAPARWSMVSRLSGSAARLTAARWSTWETSQRPAESSGRAHRGRAMVSQLGGSPDRRAMVHGLAARRVADCRIGLGIIRLGRIKHVFAGFYGSPRSSCPEICLQTCPKRGPSNPRVAQCCCSCAVLDAVGIAAPGLVGRHEAQRQRSPASAKLDAHR